MVEYLELDGKPSKFFNIKALTLLGGMGSNAEQMASRLNMTYGLSAATELERAVKDGCKGAFVAPFMITNKPHAHPDYDAL